MPRQAEATKLLRPPVHHHRAPRRLRVRHRRPPNRPHRVGRAVLSCATCRFSRTLAWRLATRCHGTSTCLRSAMGIDRPGPSVSDSRPTHPSSKQLHATQPSDRDGVDGVQETGRSPPRPANRSEVHRHYSLSAKPARRAPRDSSHPIRTRGGFAASLCAPLDEWADGDRVGGTTDAAGLGRVRMTGHDPWTRSR